MNKLQKDIVFYSNYCLHCNNLLNKLSKTPIHNKIFYVCVDDKKIKIPNIITRVPSLYLVNDKRVLIETEIDSWVDGQIAVIQSQSNQRQLQQPISDQIKNMENPSPHPSQNSDESGPEPNGDIMAYHGNEMGGALSTNYSFLEDSNNSSLNHNFTFVGDGNAQAINTPKEFNDNNQIKSELDQQYEKMMEARNSDHMSKGIQRI
jgi:hypothetical protein